VLFYWTAFHCLSSASTCATSQGFCWGGFQPWSSMCCATRPMASFSINMPGCYYSQRICGLSNPSRQVKRISALSIRFNQGVPCTRIKVLSRMTHPWMGPGWYRDGHRYGYGCKIKYLGHCFGSGMVNPALTANRYTWPEMVWSLPFGSTTEETR